MNFTVKATLPALALAATVCGSAMAEPEFDRTFTMVDEDACEVIEGDYGDPAYSMHVISECEGVGAWTVYLHEYSSFQGLSLSPADGVDSPELPFLQFGRYGRIGERLEWVTMDGEVIGVTVGFHEQPPPGEYDSPFNVYSVALKADEDPSACLISRVEFGRVRGVPDAAELAIKTMAADWDCALHERIDFTPETINGMSYHNAVLAKAEELGFIIAEDWH